MFWSRKTYSRRRARKLLKSREKLFRRRAKKLTSEAATAVEGALSELRRAIKEKKGITEAATDLESLCHLHMKKSAWDYTRETVIAIAVALVVATVVRQMWFEPMEIPSGSMRPTFQELDRLIVSKDTFGLNIPLTPAHFLFEPDLVQRTGVFIFTSEDMDIPDQDTTYFGLPGKKRLIKRCMGLPGDTLYFYGGQLWGIDRDGNPIEEFQTGEWMATLEHIPFITWSGKTVQEGNTTLFKQMNQPLGRLELRSSSLVGEIYNGSEWIPDRPYLAGGNEIHTYSDFYGMRNFAMARLLTSKELAAYSEAPLNKIGEGLLYLELRHNPSLSYPKPRLGRDHRPLLTPEVSVIPLGQHHLEQIMGAMTTSRFIVKNERAYPDRDGNGSLKQGPYRVLLPGVPDGRYEFTHGTAYKVAFGGILKKLPQDHPLNAHTPENIQRLFNVGIEMLTPYAPQARNQHFYPARFAYFRHGALYLMGAPIFEANDPLLAAFNASEEERTSKSSPSRPYLPFKDYGPPIDEEGNLDVAFLKTFGLTVPDKMYLALGDNYAASSDSRAFGFVPEENLRGTPAIILWPPGKRWATAPAPRYPIFTLPRVIIWAVFLGGLAIYFIWRRQHDRNIK